MNNLLMNLLALIIAPFVFLLAGALWIVDWVKEWKK